MQSHQCGLFYTREGTIMENTLSFWLAACVNLVSKTPRRKFVQMTKFMEQKMFLEIVLPKAAHGLKISTHNYSNPNSNSKSDFYLVHLISEMTNSFRIFYLWIWLLFILMMGFILDGLAQAEQANRYRFHPKVFYLLLHKYVDS